LISKNAIRHSLLGFAVFKPGIQREWHLEPKEVKVYICHTKSC